MHPYVHPLTVDIRQTTSRNAKKFKTAVDALNLRMLCPIEIVFHDQNETVNRLELRAKKEKKWIILVRLQSDDLDFATLRTLLGDKNPYKPLMQLFGLAIGGGKDTDRRWHNVRNRKSYFYSYYNEDPEVKGIRRSIWDILPDLSRQLYRVAPLKSGRPKEPECLAFHRIRGSFLYPCVAFWDDAYLKALLPNLTTEYLPGAWLVRDRLLSSPTIEDIRRDLRNILRYQEDEDLRGAEFMSWLTSPDFWAVSFVGGYNR